MVFHLPWKNCGGDTRTQTPGYFTLFISLHRSPRSFSSKRSQSSKASRWINMCLKRKQTLVFRETTSIVHYIQLGCKIMRDISRNIQNLHLPVSFSRHQKVSLQYVGNVTSISRFPAASNRHGIDVLAVFWHTASLLSVLSSAACSVIIICSAAFSVRAPQPLSHSVCMSMPSSSLFPSHLIPTTTPGVTDKNSTHFSQWPTSTTRHPPSSLHRCVTPRRTNH